VNRAEKIAVVEELNLAFRQTPHIVLAGFRGLTVNQANELRRRVTEAGGRYKVIKNRLAKRAAADTPAQDLAKHFEGPCAVATHETDPVALAKALADFVKGNPELELRAGLVEGRELLEAEDVKRLSALPGLTGLRAQLLALIQTPATTLVRLIGTPGTRLARVLDVRREKLE
jgi:large subunit ribosomal protein L10